MLTIPMPIIWRLHMTTRQKLGLLIVFMLGYMYECEIVLLGNEVILTSTVFRSTAAATARIVFIAQDLYGED